MPTDPTALTELPALSSVSDTDPAGRRACVENEVVLLFDQFRERLLRYLCGFGLPIADGEEVIQEVFLALFQHLLRAKSRDNLRGWLFRVAHNLALKRRQRNRRGWNVLEGSDGSDRAADPYPNPEEKLVNGQLRERLQAVVRALPEQDRRCLWLRAEGLRYREIAGILDISLGAVSLSLARSLARVASSAKR